MTCPHCGFKIAFDSRAYRRGFLCERCGSELIVSETYSRVLIIVSIVLGFGMLWTPIFQSHWVAPLRSCIGLVGLLALGLPAALAMLFLLVRLAPSLVPPPLILRHDGRNYGLGLGTPPRSCEQRQSGAGRGPKGQMGREGAERDR